MNPRPVKPQLVRHLHAQEATPRRMLLLKDALSLLLRVVPENRRHQVSIRNALLAHAALTQYLAELPHPLVRLNLVLLPVQLLLPGAEKSLQRAGGIVGTCRLPELREVLSELRIHLRRRSPFRERFLCTRAESATRVGVPNVREILLQVLGCRCLARFQRVVPVPALEVEGLTLSVLSSQGSRECWCWLRRGWRCGRRSRRGRRCSATPTPTWLIRSGRSRP